MEERICRICGMSYLYDKEDGSDVGCCCIECEMDWHAYEEDMANQQDAFDLDVFENDMINMYTDLEE